MKNIICPTDASPMAENAVKYVNHFCRSMPHSLLLLEKTSIQNLFTNPQLLSQEYSFALDNYQTASGNIAVSMETYSCTDPSMRLHNIYSIARTALSEGADLLVTGVEKEFSYNDIVGQSVGELIKNAKCPALLIPENVAYKPIQRILLVIEHEFNIAPRMQFIADIARLSGAEIFLYQINKESEIGKDHPFYQSSLDFYLTFPYRFIHFNETENGNIPAAIRKLVEKTNADLLITIPDQEAHLPCAPTLDMPYNEAGAKPLTIPLLAIDADPIQPIQLTGYPFN